MPNQAKVLMAQYTPAKTYMIAHMHFQSLDNSVALTVIEKKLIVTDYANQLIASEIEIMKKINDSHVIKLLDLFQSANHTYLTTEYCNGGAYDNLLKIECINLVYSQCLDIIGNSLQDQIALSHKQLFRVIRLFKEYISQKPFQFQEQRKSLQQAHAFQKQNCIMQYQLQFKQNRANQLLKENDTMKLQLNVYDGDLDTLKQQNFEDIKKLEQQLFTTLQQISLCKESLIEKLCVVFMKNDYTISKYSELFQNMKGSRLEMIFCQE